MAILRIQLTFGFRLIRGLSISFAVDSLNLFPQNLRLGKLHSNWSVKKCLIFCLCKTSVILLKNALFIRSFWKFNFLAITDEREIYLAIPISRQCIVGYQFPYTYTVIFVLLDNVHNWKLKWQDFELCHYCSKQAFDPNTF